MSTVLASLALSICAAFPIAKCPEVKVVNDPMIVARISRGTVFIASWLPVRNEAEMAFVLGHELGHSFARHSEVASPTSKGDREYEADMLGTLVITKMGYPCNTGAIFLRHLKKVRPEVQIEPKDRPERIEQICKQ